MTTPEATMTPAQIKAATDFLRGRVTQPCARCASSEWSIIGMRSDVVTTSVGDKMIAFVLVGCNNCYLIEEHAARPMGVTTNTVGASGGYKARYNYKPRR